MRVNEAARGFICRRYLAVLGSSKSPALSLIAEAQMMLQLYTGRIPASGFRLECSGASRSARGERFQGLDVERRVSFVNGHVWHIRQRCFGT